MRSEAPSAWMTATSVTGSVPMTLARLVVPSLKLTVMVALSPAPVTTWLLVRILPSLLRMIPEPEPAPELLETLTFTTEGSTDWETFSTVPSWTTVVLVAWNGLEELFVVPVELSSLKAWKRAEPPTPAAPPRTSAPTSTAAVRPRPREVLRRRRGRCVAGRPRRRRLLLVRRDRPRRLRTLRGLSRLGLVLMGVVAEPALRGVSGAGVGCGARADRSLRLRVVVGLALGVVRVLVLLVHDSDSRQSS